MCNRTIRTVTSITPLGELVIPTDSLLDPMTPAQLVQERVSITAAREQGQAVYRCHECREPVYIAKALGTDGSGGLHFRHFHSEAAKDCKWRSGPSVRDLGAVKYSGQQEGDDHYVLKHAPAETLAQDPGFSQIAVEKQILGPVSGTRRQPDVSALFSDGRPVGFDLQLATMAVRTSMAATASISRTGFTMSG
jgi:hypothetical protein